MNSATVGVAARLGIRLAIVLGLGLLWARAPLAEGTPEPRSDQTVLRDLIKGELKDADFTAGLIRTVLAKTTVENRPVVYEKLMGRNGGATDKPPEVFHRFPYEEHFRIMRASSKNNAKAFATALSAAAIALAWPAASSDLERIRQQDLKTLNAIARDFAHASAEYGILAENFRGWTVIEETQKKLKGTWTWHRWRNLIVPEMLVADFDNPRWLHEVSDKKNHAKVPATLIQDWADTNLKTWCEPIDVESGKEKWTLDGIKGATPSDRRAGALNGLRFPLDGLNHPPLLVHPAVHRWATELKDRNISSQYQDGLGKWIFEQSLGSPIACAWLQEENKANNDVAKLCLFARARGHFAGASVAPEVKEVLKDAKLEGQSYEQTLARWSNAAQRGYFKRYPIAVDTDFVRSSEEQRAASNYGLLSYQGPAEDALQQERSEAKTLVEGVWATLSAELAKLDRVLTTQAGQIEFVLKWLGVGPTGNPEADVLIAERLAAIGDGVFSTKDVRAALHDVMHAPTKDKSPEWILKEWAKLDALEFLAERAPDGLWDLYPKVWQNNTWVADPNLNGNFHQRIPHLEQLYLTATKRKYITTSDETFSMQANLSAAVNSGSGGSVMQSRAAMIVATHAKLACSNHINTGLPDTFKTLVHHVATNVHNATEGTRSPVPVNFILAHLAAYASLYHRYGDVRNVDATEHYIALDLSDSANNLKVEAQPLLGDDPHRAYSRWLDYLTLMLVDEQPLKAFAWSSRAQVASLVVSLLYLRNEEALKTEMILSGGFTKAWHVAAMTAGNAIRQTQKLPRLNLCETSCNDKVGTKIDFPTFAEALLWKQLVWMKAAYAALLRNTAFSRALSTESERILRIDVCGTLLTDAQFDKKGMLIFPEASFPEDARRPWNNHANGLEGWGNEFFNREEDGARSRAETALEIYANGYTRPGTNVVIAQLLSAQLRLHVAPSQCLAEARKAEMEAAQAELWAAMSAHAAAKLEEAALKSISEAFGSDAKAAEAMEQLSHSEADIAKLATDVATIRTQITNNAHQSAVERLQHTQKGHESIRRVFEYRQAEYAASVALLRTLKRALIGENDSPSVISQVTSDALKKIEDQEAAIDNAEAEAKRNWWAGLVKSLVQVVCTVVGTIFGAPMLGSAIGGALGNLIGGIIKGESFEKILLNAASDGMAIAASAGINIEAKFTELAGKALDTTGVGDAIKSFETTYDSVVRKLPDIRIGGKWIEEVRGSLTSGFNQANSYVGRGQVLVDTTLTQLASNLTIDAETTLKDLGAQIEEKIQTLEVGALEDILKAGGITIPDLQYKKPDAARIVSQLFVANLPSEFVQAKRISGWQEFLNSKRQNTSAWSSTLQDEVRNKLKECFNLADGSNELDEMIVQARMCLDPNLGVKEVADALKGWSDEFQTRMDEVRKAVEDSRWTSACNHLEDVKKWVTRADDAPNRDKGWSALTDAISNAEEECAKHREEYDTASANLQDWNIKVQNARSEEQKTALAKAASAIEKRIKELECDNAVLTTTIRGLQHRAARLRATAAESRAKAGTLAVDERLHRVTAAKGRYDAAKSYFGAAGTLHSVGNKAADDLDHLQTLVFESENQTRAAQQVNLKLKRRTYFEGQKAYLLETVESRTRKNRPWAGMEVTPRIHALFIESNDEGVNRTYANRIEADKTVWSAERKR